MYGTTNSGGANGVGTVFRLIPQVGGGYQYCKLFDFNGTNGANPSQAATLTWDSKGNLYGTTINGGANNLGTIFKISTTGTFTKLWDFNGTNGSNPYGGVVLDAQGNMYGTTKFGGSGGGVFGTVYELSAAGKFSTLIDFFQWGNGANGNNPTSSLIIDPQGNLYGTARSVFKIAPNGTYTNILGVSSYAGSAAALAIDSHGNLYGTTIAGGANGVGNVFELQASSMQTYSVSGQVTLNGMGLPNVNVTLGIGLSSTTDSNGNYTISSVLPGSYSVTPSISNYTVAPVSASVTVANANITGVNFTASSVAYVYTDFFDFGNTVSQYPYGPVTLDGSGNLYGTTLGSTITNGPGTVFKLSPTAVYTDLFNLPITYWGVVDGAWYFPFGAYPVTGVTLDPNGTIFATTQVDPYTSDYGSVIKIGSSGGGTQIMGYSNTSHGANPSAVTLDPYGFVYGTNNSGGANGLGDVFRLIPQADGSYNFVDLHDFAGPDGSNPSQSATLAQDPSGNLYGTTISGGAYGLGTIFKVTTAGVYTKLWDFNGANGANPYGGVVLDSKGNLYGTTSTGGAVLGNLGTVYKLSATGVFTTLIDFNLWGNGANGNNPTSNLVMDAQGNLYGTARSVFRINSDGTYVNLLGVGSYIGSAASLAIDGTGSLFGTTIYGGTHGLGNVFRLSIGLKLLSLSPGTVIGGSPSTGTVTLSTPAGPGGTVVNLTSTSTFATVPSSITIPAGSTSGTFVVSTSADATLTAATITASTGGASVYATLNINPAVLLSLTLQPSTVTGGNSVTGTVSLTGPAPSPGFVVNLASNSLSATVPAAVTVATGQTSVSFTVNTTGVSPAAVAQITASATGSVTASANLTINPAIIQSITLSSPTVTGGTSTTGTVTLNGKAPSAGAVVTLSSNNGGITVPPSVTVPAFMTSATFTVNTIPVSTVVTAKITGILGVSLPAVITVNPPTVSTITFNPASVIGGASTTGSVTLNGTAPSGGIVISLSSNSIYATVPGTVTVYGGTTSSTFKAVTIAVSPSPVTVTVTGTQGGNSALGMFVINPVGLSSLTIAPSSVPGGSTSIGTVTLTGPAQAGGALVTLSSGSSNATVPASVTVPAGSTSAVFQITTQLVTTTVTAPISATLITTKSANLTIVPLTLVSLTLNPTSVTGGNTSTGTVTLNGSAGAGGVAIILSSNNGGISVPPSVTVPSGSASATFTVSTTPVSSVVSAQITAVMGTVSIRTGITVNPPTLLSLTVSPPSVVGGSSSTGKVTLNGTAPSGGITVLLSSNTSSASVPQSVVVYGGTTSSTFKVAANPVSVQVTATITATNASTSLTTTVTINPAGISAISLSPSSLPGGLTSNCTVTLSNPAPTGGSTVTLSSNNLNATIAAFVVVPAGSTTASVQVNTVPVLAVTTVTISGTLVGTVSATLTINPTALIGISLSPSTVYGGNPTTGSATLSGPAPTGGVVVALSSNNGGVTVPPSVTVLAGATSATFTVNTIPVSSNVTATITGTLNGANQRATLMVLPPITLASVTLNPSTVVGGTTSTGTVTLNEAALTSQTITLSSNNGGITVPPSVTIPAGSTSATFTVSTTPVSSMVSAKIKSALGSTSINTPITVNPPTLSAITLSPSTVIGGGLVTGTVTINGTAPTGGITITLNSDNSAATVSTTVTVYGGNTTATFRITTSAVTSSLTANIMGNKGLPDQISVPLTINP